MNTVAGVSRGGRIREGSMKKAVFIVVMSLLVAFGLFAVPLGCYGCPSVWIPQSFWVGAGNDRWSSGLSFDYDDQLSFAEYFSLAAPAWRLDVNMLGITNRGWQDGWSAGDASAVGDGVRVSGRYDSTGIILNLPIDIVDGRWFFLSVEPAVGVSIVGRQGYVVFQNTVHRALGMPQVFLAYETDSNNVHASLGGEVSMGGRLPLLWRSSLAIGVRGVFENNIGFNYRQRALAFVELEDRFGTGILSASLGYTWTQTQSSWTTARLYDDYVRGFTLGYGVNVGFLRLGYTCRPDTRRGFGTFGIDVMSFFMPSYWRRSDFFISLGKTSMMDVTFFDYGLELPIGCSGFSLVVRSRYVSGNPTCGGSSSDGDGSSGLGRFERNYDGVLLGGKYRFSGFVGLATPYVQLCAGAMGWEALNLVNMNEVLDVDGVVVRNRVHSHSTGRLYSFAMDAELGLTVLPEGALTSLGAELRFNLHAGVTFIHNPTEVSAHLAAYTSDGSKVSMFMPRFGFSLLVGYDV